jgi:hypothetical protein
VGFARQFTPGAHAKQDAQFYQLFRDKFEDHHIVIRPEDDGWKLLEECEQRDNDFTLSPQDLKNWAEDNALELGDANTENFNNIVATHSKYILKTPYVGDDYVKRWCICPYVP